MTTSHAAAPSQNPIGGGLYQSIELFEIVQPEDYADNEDIGVNYEATIQRAVGDINVSAIGPAQSAFGMEWATAIFAMGEEAAENTATADLGDFAIIDPADRNANLNRLQPMWRSPVNGYIGGFEDLAGGGGAQKGIQIMTGQWDGCARERVDLRVKRRLKTDDTVLVLVHTIINDPLAEETWQTFISVDFRCVIYAHG